MRRNFLMALAATPLLTAVPALARTPLAAVPISRIDAGWWRDRHTAKLAELRTRQPSLIFLGDSITQQWEEPRLPEPPGFVPSWNRFYGDRNAVNLGFRGDATSHLLWRIQNGEVSGIAPKVAVILIGANNLGHLRWSADDTLAGIDAIIKELQRRLPKTKILLLSVLPSERSEWTSTTTLAINKALPARYPAGGAVMFVDVTRVFMKNGRINRDMFIEGQLPPGAELLHPSVQGQIGLSEAIEPSLAGLMGDHIHK